MSRTIKTCDECSSGYFADTSRMPALCPECAHYLYGYPNCSHHMENGRCRHCYWDGSATYFIRSLKEADPEAPSL